MWLKDAVIDVKILDSRGCMKMLLTKSILKGMIIAIGDI